MNALMTSAKVILAVFILFAASHFSLHEGMHEKSVKTISSLGFEEDKGLAFEHTDRVVWIPSELSWGIQALILLPVLFMLFLLSFAKRTRHDILCSPVFHQANYVSHSS